MAKPKGTVTVSVLAERQAAGMHAVEPVCRMVRATAPNAKCGSVPGVPAMSSGAIHMAPQIPEIDQINLASKLNARLCVEVLIESDVNLAALAEHRMNNWTDEDDLGFISVGTGIGAGLVVEGSLMRGTTGDAGEIGGDSHA
ncbi:MAG: ROK family protein [Rhodobacteraceae bacterium]|nr:ROK family protein [Paracoccaceae bacterium]